MSEYTNWLSPQKEEFLALSGISIIKSGAREWKDKLKGTGFLFFHNNIHFLITANHVIKDDNFDLVFIRRDKDLINLPFNELKKTNSKVIRDTENDIAIVPLTIFDEIKSLINHTELSKEIVYNNIPTNRLHID